MNEKLWTEVDNYIGNLLLPPDPILEAALTASDESGLPKIGVSPAQGKMLQLFAQLRGASRILEIGTLGGYSTIWLARALPSDGHLITLEMEQKHANVARANLARAGFEKAVEVRVGPASESLSQLVKEGAKPFDMIFIDADKKGYPDYFAWALKLSRPGTLIIADNIVRKGTVLDTTTSDPSLQGTRRFNEVLAAEPRVSATIIQTVGSKGHDGFALALVK